MTAAQTARAGKRTCPTDSKKERNLEKDLVKGGSRNESTLLHRRLAKLSGKVQMPEPRRPSSPPQREEGDGYGASDWYQLPGSGQRVVNR